MAKVLIACEESQVVCIEFRKLGHESYSCDILEPSGGHPEWHLKMDVFSSLLVEPWDLIIMHPPCTALSVSGNGTYGKGKPKHEDRILAVEWTQRLWNKALSICDHVAMENPVGVLNSMGNFPKPQYIQPYQFGHGETKKTGLWLHNLPKLIPTDIVEGREQRIWKLPPSEDRAKLRSKTFPGIAKGLASQYIAFINSKLNAREWNSKFENMDIDKSNNIILEYL